MKRNTSVQALPGSGQTPWWWAAGGAVLGVCLVLTVCAPAHWLTRQVTEASGGRLTFAQVRGTVWDGSAQVVVAGGDGSLDAVALPGAMSWRLRPALRGVSLALSVPCCAAAALQLDVQPNGAGARVSLADAVSQWPATLLAGLGTPWNTLALQGQLQASTQGLSVEWAQGRVSLSGSAQVDAQRMSSRISTLKPMGSYRVVLQGGASASLQLSTLEGPLQLNGTGQWVGARMRFRGEASAEPERLEALSNLLNIIGRRNGARSIIQVG